MALPAALAAESGLRQTSVTASARQMANAAQIRTMHLPTPPALRPVMNYPASLAADSGDLLLRTAAQYQLQGFAKYQLQGIAKPCNDKA
jgi:hypothetical protein